MFYLKLTDHTKFKGKASKNKGIILNKLSAQCANKVDYGIHEIFIYTIGATISPYHTI